MKRTKISPLKAGITALLLSSTLSCSTKLTESESLPVETGVSKTLAEYRKAVLRQVAYDINLNVPAQKQEPILAAETITFNLLENNQPLQIDFKEKREHIQQMSINRKEIPVVFENEHILISPEHLKEGKNQIAITFIAGDLSLNRNEDYLYTLLVPDRARTVFPAFDQPNLKATFKLSLTIPKEWSALANAPLQDSSLAGNNKTYQYQTSDTISTYLFAFAAGKFDRVTKEAGGRTMNFYHRETDSSKIKESILPIFKIHQDALAFMQDYTQIPYPFKKFDFVAIPDFQYGGMEHVGAIQYKASSLFLDEGATKDQKVSRSSLISHETAHMWFGDLVTMQWFNDVWMKEVFANFMADKITQVSLAESNYDLKFVLDHFPAAYGVDRTAGANPIRQQLDNLQDAGTMYGSIIYHKAPIVMRQLERLMGEDEFRQGLREYLKEYAYGNATWPDLIAIMDAHTPADLESWNQVWVNEPGRPVINYQLETDDNRITQLRFSQKGEDGSDKIWPQLFEVALVYPDHVEELTVNMNGKQISIEEAVGKPAPSFMLFNSTGQGYGLFPIDEKMLSVVYTLQDPVTRAAVYINLYENMLSGRFVKPMQLLDLYRASFSKEKEELNLKQLTGQISNIYWSFLKPEERKQLAASLEKELFNAMQQTEAPNSKKVLFKTYQSIALTQEAQDVLYMVWKSRKAPAGVKLTEDDYTSLALSLAIRDYADGEILQEQLTRIQNPDRQKRLQFLMPALSADVTQRDAFFASLKEEENREKEAWVASALSYLHHPLRAETSEKYLQESLELLEDIQLTGDIFFPTNWLMATFGSYQSPEASAVVRNFLEARPNYNPKLKAKILQAADGVFRAERLTNDVK
ncbi:M1 family metallopeptidase [Pontibacter silvestris]|uniref:Aminopeptidase N n=1 Tax=Pontibacter silvestris TaxID=2305183 RepID=A0ABW4WY45_9BACT|nr:M1 family aminopeptidase [Pontibacter silvestris]MCC9135239.1 M1 family aminopeptidase [Pontibacter silvestris]